MEEKQEQRNIQQPSSQSDHGLPHYEPSDHRSVRHATTYCETVIHLIKASIGTGILAMPNAFAKSGYVIGIIGTILIGVLCTYCMRILVKVQYELCKRNQVPAMAYIDIAKNSAKAGPDCSKDTKCLPLSANIFVLGFQIGAACIYIIFVSKNIKQVLEYYVSFKIDVRIYCLIILIPILITATINNLKFLSILSLSANITTIGGFIIIFIYIFQDASKFSNYLKNRTKFGKVSEYPLFAGTVVFSMEAIGVVMPLENEMKNPLLFTSMFGVLNMAMIPTIFLYILVGFTGYLRYGNNVEGSITLSLPEDEVLSQVCRILLSFGIFSTYILALFVAYDIIWKAYIQPKYEFPEHTWKVWSLQYLVRVLLIILTCILSVLIPNIELFISLVGSLCLATAGIAYPALFNLFTYWYDYEGVRSCLLNSWYIFIIIIGIVICIIGVTISLIDIYTTLYK